MSTQQTPHKLVIQMSGAPGSGKSTVASLLGRAIGAVVLDHDRVRSTMINFNIPFDQAAKLAYELQWELVRNLTEQGHSVIVDSTCNFQEVLDEGSSCAKRYGHAYWYVECRVQDVDLLDQRLRTRNPMPSQRTGVDYPPQAAAAARGAHVDEDHRAIFKKWMEHPCRPENNVIIVDSTGDPETLRDHILAQIVGIHQPETRLVMAS